MYRQLGLFGVLVMKHSTKQYNTRSHNINWVSVSLSSYLATFTSSWKFFAYCWRTWNDSKRLLKCKLIFLRSQLVKPNICSYDDKKYKQKFFFQALTSTFNADISIKWWIQEESRLYWFAYCDFLCFLCVSLCKIAYVTKY